MSANIENHLQYFEKHKYFRRRTVYIKPATDRKSENMINRKTALHNW